MDGMSVKILGVQGIRSLNEFQRLVQITICNNVIILNVLKGGRSCWPRSVRNNLAFVVIVSWSPQSSYYEFILFCMMRPCVGRSHSIITTDR